MTNSAKQQKEAEKILLVEYYQLERDLDEAKQCTQDGIDAGNLRKARIYAKRERLLAEQVKSYKIVITHLRNDTMCREDLGEG